MARPKPTTLREKTDPKTWKSVEILKLPTLYAVLYRGELFAERKSSLTNDKRVYLSTTHTSKAHAANHVARLNAYFHTDEFTLGVVQPTP